MAFKLPRLQVGYDKVPGLFPRYWDQAMSRIEDLLNQIIAIPEIEAALGRLDEATAAANTAAQNAQTASNNQTKESSLVNSYVDVTSYTAPLLSSNAEGIVTIKSHKRIYGDQALNPSVSVQGATLVTDAGPESIVRVYYNDPSRAGGAVSYSFTIDPDAPVAQGGDAHSVGAVGVPTTGNSDGEAVTPPGYVRFRVNEPIVAEP